jgi:hypothetical protein
MPDVVAEEAKTVRSLRCSRRIINRYLRVSMIIEYLESLLCIV